MRHYSSRARHPPRFDNERTIKIKRRRLVGHATDSVPLPNPTAISWRMPFQRLRPQEYTLRARNPPTVPARRGGNPRSSAGRRRQPYARSLARSYGVVYALIAGGGGLRDGQLSYVLRTSSRKYYGSELVQVDVGQSSGGGGGGLANAWRRFSARMHVGQGIKRRQSNHVGTKAGRPGATTSRLYSAAVAALFSRERAPKGQNTSNWGQNLGRPLPRSCESRDRRVAWPVPRWWGHRGGDPYQFVRPAARHARPVAATGARARPGPAGPCLVPPGLSREPGG